MIKFCKCDDKIYAFEIGNLFFDLRRWYVVWWDKDDGPCNKEFEGWSDIWFTAYELEEIIEANDGDVKYKKLCFLKTFFDAKIKQFLLKLLYTVLVFLTGYFLNY